MSQQNEIGASGAVATIYTSALCGYCHMAKSLLQREGISYDEIRVDQDPHLRQEMEARSGRYTVPQIFFGDRHIGGCDDLMALARQGRLDEFQ
ncbi:MAG: glutaredoxin 3 [Gammaproteobacteria bacterium]|nr:glutaredoxin 3 [Gammaproteobacteria bacterium]